MRRATASVLILLMLASPGCLSSSYRIANDELSRLARTAPEQRWQAVRATQRMLESDHPPGTVTAHHGDVPLLIMPTVFWYRGRSWGVPSRWRANPAGARVDARAPMASSGSGGRSGGRSNGLDPAAVALVVAAAAGIVFVLAGTEGARYDGWVGVPPDETLFLDNPDGSVTSVPLAALTPELADGAQGATLYEESEGRYVRLGRAPLHRVGFTIQSGVAAAMVPRLDGSGHGFGIGGRGFFGGYPVRQLGVGVCADVLAGAAGSLVALVGGELQVMPLLQVGAYLGAGWASLTSDDHSRRSGGWFVRGGAQLELPVTTRFAASLRAGVTRMEYGGAVGVLLMPELSLGLSIY